MKREFSDKQKEWLKENDFIVLKGSAIKYLDCVQIEIVIEINKNVATYFTTERKQLYGKKENIDYYIFQLKKAYKLGEEFKNLEE